MLLAVDTSAGTSVAVVDREAGILAEHSSDDTRRHAEVVGDLIVACLADAGIAVSELSGVVAGMGPGPFTGLRVGIAAARAFAVGAGKIVVPVVSHDAVAFGQDGLFVVATDARRGEVYWSAYDGPDAVRTRGPELVKAGELELAVPAGHRIIRAATVSAGSLGMLAETLYATGRPFAADEPLYLRSPDVTLSAGPKRVTS
ncbi:MAG: tRNA (adenosine(37)-N6)-threonylcarbamoyltransferase complex dimerization subunit type 1 TsaB [Micrococcales bacterium 70-64]|nr:tRNA (adenosine(37)-N6)-threonylcarbamoyltransferase complex dimerization subunit type 1 TsaB [Leifsonia sp.]ODU63256.1 MAG: tRNA (adenosine(37)-N6)-threonylcarbamoyltransferase complex dimerization subunit type 1 TsaB [Leifsonia sp. SCN 70-46]OJX84947.1 MAG: tRNA (adenosine(37)-N6)-threonylcarbamoyltransferase complex dimerization subunit type 1 TsaB [Micrococcales bacterium 70-64]